MSDFESCSFVLNDKIFCIWNSSCILWPIMTTGIIEFFSNSGYWGVFLITAIENIFPAIPSEVVLPLIGKSVATGNMNFFLAVFVATLGGLIGTTFWYMIGWYMPAAMLEKFLAKYGAYIAITPRDFRKATRFFEKYEIPAILFGRMMPVIRSVISLPAGSVRMNFKQFLLYTTIGSLIWNIALIGIGYYLLGNFVIIEKYISPVSTGVIILCIVIYIVHVLNFIFNKPK